MESSGAELALESHLEQGKEAWPWNFISPLHLSFRGEAGQGSLQRLGLTWGWVRLLLSGEANSQEKKVAEGLSSLYGLRRQ